MFLVMGMSVVGLLILVIAGFYASSDAVNYTSLLILECFVGVILPLIALVFLWFFRLAKQASVGSTATKDDAMAPSGSNNSSAMAYLETTSAGVLEL